MLDNFSPSQMVMLRGRGMRLQKAVGAPFPDASGIHLSYIIIINNHNQYYNPNI